MQTLNHVYFPSRVYIVGLSIGHVQKSITETLKYVILGTYCYILHLVWNINRQQIPPLDSGFCPRLCLSPLKPISASSVITVLHQMFIGRPRFLFPRGVPLRATLQI